MGRSLGEIFKDFACFVEDFELLWEEYTGLCKLDCYSVEREDTD